MTGTFINAGTVITGSFIGLALRSRFPERFKKIAFQAIGLFTLILGVSMAIKSQEILFLVISLVLGALLGEGLLIDKQINRFGEFLKKKTGSQNHNFADGFITAFLLFCMGSMSIMGPIEEGMGGTSDLLLAKAVLDGFSSAALAAALGTGVLFSVIPLLIYQGGITLLAGLLSQYVDQSLILELSAVGGVLLVGLGISILEIKEIKTSNMLPSLVIVVILNLVFN